MDLRILFVNVFHVAWNMYLLSINLINIYDQWLKQLIWTFVHCWKFLHLNFADKIQFFCSNVVQVHNVRLFGIVVLYYIIFLIISVISSPLNSCCSWINDFTMCWACTLSRDSSAADEALVWPKQLFSILLTKYTATRFSNNFIIIHEASKSI